MQYTLKTNRAWFRRCIKINHAHMKAVQSLHQKSAIDCAGYRRALAKIVRRARQEGLSNVECKQYLVVNKLSH